ncbi:hypothetical protein [Rhizobium sp. Leaf341]|uniref:hypothetical protein n=1 Tax=Rhizobium sp. Leaf341 TaxID=1736344 RepID=UPI000714C477|nr:hypothetical protein [Rhizobium sp. Leaf341]KQR75747.1 hypothetical protein ASG03_18930 [Rhizobium sp. Leaf341]
MFKVVENLTFWWPVKVSEPDDAKPGKSIEHVFEVQFAIQSSAEARASARARTAIIAEIKADITDEQLFEVQDRVEEHDLKAMRRVLKNWRKIADEDGAEIPFTEETFAAVWAHQRVRTALVRAYDEAITLEKGRVKN